MILTHGPGKASSGPRPVNGGAAATWERPRPEERAHRIRFSKQLSTNGRRSYQMVKTSPFVVSKINTTNHSPRCKIMHVTA
jgi:hypothetical protein